MNRTALPSETLGRSVPGRFRGPFVRWPRVADAVLAIAVFLATVFLEDGPGDAVAVRSITDVPLPALLLFAVAATALYWRRRRPIAVLGVAMVAWALTLGSGYSDLGGVAIIALYSTGRYAADGWRGRVGVVVAVVVVIVDGLLDPVPWGRSASEPWSCSGPGTSVDVCGFAPSVPRSSARSRPPRHGGSSPRSAPTSLVNCTTWSPTG